MANPERGEVALVVGDRTYTLKLSMNAAVTLEEKLKKPIGQILREAGTLNFKAIRTLVWLLLQKHHSEDFRNESQVGELIDEAGGVPKFMETLERLVEVNQPDEAGDKTGNPPTAQSGTGGDSTSNSADSD